MRSGSPYPGDDPISEAGVLERQASQRILEHRPLIAATGARATGSGHHPNLPPARAISEKGEMPPIERPDGIGAVGETPRSTTRTLGVDQVKVAAEGRLEDQLAGELGGGGRPGPGPRRLRCRRGGGGSRGRGGCLWAEERRLEVGRIGP